ncbi:MAG TPA: GNAT family N-acetyltransferase [bacterium]|nr:GNAT family N-acetyltransferase [bacterium]
MAGEVTHDREGQRFVVSRDGAEAYLDYAPLGDGRVDFRSTFTPPELRGQGLAAAIVAEALAWARGEGLEVVPSCSYVRHYLDKESAS